MSLICFVSQCHTARSAPPPPPVPTGRPPVTGRSRRHLPGAWPGGRGGLCPISVVSRRAACVPDGWPVTSRRSVTAAVTALYRLWQSGGVITVPRSRRPCSRPLGRPSSPRGSPTRPLGAAVDTSTAWAVLLKSARLCGSLPSARTLHYSL